MRKFLLLQKLAFLKHKNEVNEMSEINGYNVEALLSFKEMVKNDPTQADRQPKVLAKWIGDERSEVEFQDIFIHIGGENRLNAMQMLLASFAACDVEVIAFHCSLLNLKIESLSVEATGHFNVQSYLGLENAPGSGYDSISYIIRLKAPEATPEQISYLRERCERSSPVGDSLERRIPMKMEFEHV